MVIDGKILPSSNITVLVNDIVKKAKHEFDPVGRNSPVEQLSKTELPHGLIGNAEISRELSQRIRKSTTPRKYLSKVPWIDLAKITERYYNPGHVKDFLIRQDAYTLHRPIRHRFRRRQIFTKGIHDLWQADLVYMKSLMLHNDVVKYLLTCIDTFSKYAWVRSLKTSLDFALKKHSKSILKEKFPLYLQTDKALS